MDHNFEESVLEDIKGMEHRLTEMEEKIDDMIESKKGLAQSIIGGGEEWLTELSTDELRDMVALRR